MSSAAEDADILAQGCRALHALSSTFDVDTGQFSDNPRAGWEKIMFACTKVAKKFAGAQGKPLTRQSPDGEELPSEFVSSEADRLGKVCNQLLTGHIATGPQFGRILDDKAEP